MKIGETNDFLTSEFFSKGGIIFRLLHLVKFGPKKPSLVAKNSFMITIFHPFQQKNSWKYDNFRLNKDENFALVTLLMPPRQKV